MHQGSFLSDLENNDSFLRIGIMGGTFDPIHDGHTHLARSAYQQCDLDCIIWSIAHQPWHKSDRVISSYHHRLNMLILALQSLPGHIKNIIDDEESQRDQPSYALHLLSRLKARFTKAHFFWLMGQDSWSSLSEWYRVEALVQNTCFVIYPRAFQRLSQRKKDDDGFYHKVSSFWLNGQEFSFCSSKIRDTIADCRSAEGLDTKVFHYICQHQLYSSFNCSEE